MVMESKSSCNLSVENATRRSRLNRGTNIFIRWAGRIRRTFFPTTAVSNRTRSVASTPVLAAASKLQGDFVRNVDKLSASIAMDSATSVINRAALVIACLALATTVDALVSAMPVTQPNHEGASSAAWAERCSHLLCNSRADMANNDLSPLIQDLLYAQDHRLLCDPVGMALHRAISAGVADDFVVATVRDRVQRHKVSQAFAGPFRLPCLQNGNVILGSDVRRRAISIPAQYLNGHSLTLGGSGSGKTTKAKRLVLQVAPTVRGLWLFDLRKQEFTGLAPFLACLKIELIVIPARFLCLNPLQVPKNVDPRDWSPRVADMLVQVLRLPPRATKLLHVTLLESYDRFGILSGGARFPTVFELRDAVSANDQANAQARQAVVDALDPVLLSLRPVLSYRRGWSSDDLAKRHLVIELGGIAEADKDLVLNSLILPEFASRIARGVSNPDMDLWIVCDEAQRLVSPNSFTGGVGDLIALVRGTGIGLDLSVQSADIAPSILSNTACKFIGRCGSAADYDLIGAAMGLSVEQRRHLTHTLVPGMFVGQVGDGDWRHPFLFQVSPLGCVGKNTDAAPQIANPLLLELSLTNQSSIHGSGTGHSQAGLDSLSALPTDPAPEFLHWKPGGSNGGSCNAPIPVHGEPLLSSAERRFLKAVVDSPGLPSSAYAKLCRVGTHQAVALRKQLVASGYLREHRVNVSGRGRVSIVLEPLSSAIDAVQNDWKEI